MHLSEKGFDIQGLKEGEIMIHHHINQGPNAVAMGQSNHSEIPSETSGFRFSGRSTLNKLRGANDALSFVGLFLDMLSSDPHSSRMLISAGTEVNTLYYDVSSDSYYKITKANVVKDNNGDIVSKTVTYDYYSDYGYDTKSGQYVGIDKQGTRTETYNVKTGKTTTENGDDEN